MAANQTAKQTLLESAHRGRYASARFSWVTAPSVLCFTNVGLVASGDVGIVL
ncbi:MAG: hypothetical protein AVDCRST_MAG29-2121 [uncultured Nocardioidaceae bacterium]|uniref:Uncharacterized protein n=1 Tax=uncultured Nocardioidaceae bacterium TaxID=253824 RepID=A0A6J4M449_9ACTN|nr:MAG: hypothetical protein AVDCRST_MAG29-2121 [uncultured Nocardioidaceae bacterium]